MNKVQPNFDNGIEYIRLRELPFTQAIKFNNWIAPVQIFQMRVMDKIYDDCVSYSEYEFWCENQTANPLFQHLPSF